MDNNNCAGQLGVDEGVVGVRVDDGLVMTLKILPGGEYVVGRPPEAEREVDDLAAAIETSCTRAMEH